MRLLDANEYLAERTNAFVSLVFGYSVLALLYQNKAAYGVNAYLYLYHFPMASMLTHCRFFGKAVLGLIQAFCFNWLYFEIGEVPRVRSSCKRLTPNPRRLQRPYSCYSPIHLLWLVLPDHSKRFCSYQNSNPLDQLSFTLHHGLCDCWSMLVQARPCP